MSKQHSRSKKVRDKSHPIERIRGEVEHVFERLADNWQEFEQSVAEKLPDWVPGFIKPRVDASESRDSLEFVIEMPGLDAADISVRVEDGVLVIEGETSSEREQEDRNYYLKERSSQRYYRSFSLPADVDENAVNATCKNGLLTISIPHRVKKKDKVRKVKVTGIE